MKCTGSWKCAIGAFPRLCPEETRQMAHFELLRALQAGAATREEGEKTP